MRAWTRTHARTRGRIRARLTRDCCLQLFGDILGVSFVLFERLFWVR